MSPANRIPGVAFCGPGEPSPTERSDAEAIGLAVATAGCLLYCGGLGGSMEAACMGAKRGGGTTIGILPGYDASAANKWVDIPICTGMGHGRNAILVASVDVVVACGGSWGTLSEIALANKLGRPVVVQGIWSHALRAAFSDKEFATSEQSVRFAENPEQCVAIALRMIAESV